LHCLRVLIMLGWRHDILYLWNKFGELEHYWQIGTYIAHS
jgi:hypothetical protein